MHPLVVSLCMFRLACRKEGTVFNVQHVWIYSNSTSRMIIIYKDKALDKHITVNLHENPHDIERWLQEELTHAGQRGNFFSANPNQVGASFTGNPHSSFSPPRPVQPPAKGPASKSGNFGKGLLWRLGMGASDNKVEFHL